MKKSRTNPIHYSPTANEMSHELNIGSMKEKMAINMQKTREAGIVATPIEYTKEPEINE
ncbi:MAG: hypothetical protein ACI35P_11220 [Bacillus sp. (in: firmicutes)]